MTRYPTLLSTCLLLTFCAAQAATAQVIRTDNDQLFSQLLNGIPGTDEDDDCFGCAIAVGDFDGDGFGDVAVGVPGRDIAGLEAAGRVLIIPGSASGPDTSSVPQWHRNNGTVKGQAAAGERFGGVLAVGDFNGDDYDDLALGIPTAEVDGLAEAGEVAVLHGSALGLTATVPDDQVWQKGDLGIAGAQDDQFGFALAAGDIDGDGRDDLVIGAPGVTIAGAAGAGAAYVLYGTVSGLTAAGSQNFDQNAPGVPDLSEAGDAFGSSLTLADFNGDGKKDLALGVVGENDAVGLAQFFTGGAAGLTPSDESFTIPNASGSIDLAESLVACDFNRDGFQDLVVGAPGWDDEGVSNFGVLFVLLGDPVDLLTSPGVIGQGILGAVPEPFDNFSSALAAADFNGDGFCDLAIGVPGEGLEDLGIIFAGWAHVIPGSAQGFRLSPQDLSESDPEIQGDAESGDLFGLAMAAGDLNGDQVPELLVGTLQSTPTAERAGSLHGFFGDKILFADGFETGDFSAWSQVVGN